MATLVQMETEVHFELGLAATTAGTEKTLVDGWLNSGVVDVLARTGCYVVSAAVSLSAAEGDYDLLADLGLDTLAVRSMRWTSTNGGGVPERVSPEEIERLRATPDAQASGWPASYYAVAGANLLMVWPTPTAADTITVIHTPRPTAMSLSSHDPSNATYGGIHAEWHDAVVLYAEWKGASGSDDQSSAQGERYRVLYEGQDGNHGRLAQIRVASRKHGGRMGRAVFHPSRRRPARGNSIYPA